MTTRSKILKVLGKFKKKYIAELLGISRMTLNRKLRDNDFSTSEIETLKKGQIID